MNLKYLVMIAAFAVACGGSQNTSDPNASNNNRGNNRGNNNSSVQTNEDGTLVETGPTEEELEAMRLEAAQEAFDEAGRLYENSTLEDRDYDAIEAALETAFEQDPTLIDAIFNLGQLKQERGDLEGAIELYNRVTELQEGYGRGRAAIGYLMLQDGDEAGAEAYFLECIEQSPLEPGCNVNLSILYRRRALENDDAELMQQSIDRLRFALGGDAHNGDAYANLASAYFAQGRMELARLVCENAILQGVDEAVLHNRLGLIALAQDDVINAYQEFQAAVLRDPSYVDAQTNIGAMALSFRDYETAKNAFEVVLEHRPDNLGARLSYGVSLRGVDQLEAAETQYCAVLEADPNSLEAVYNLGLLFEEYQQDYELAITFYNHWSTLPGASSAPQAEEIPHRADVLGQLMEAMMEMGEYTPPGLTAQCAP